ncbi:MAG: bifunctional pyr operon transcriptional regulator/uracil phosphoribosyltransferase PyrR [Jatrophihabitantaceae bacterium]
MRRVFAGSPKTVLQPADLSRVLDRIAHQILEKTHGGHDVVLLGIPTRGQQLASRLADRIASFGQLKVGLGSLDITLYRDDLRTQAVRPLGRTVEPPGGIDGKLVILVDDVLFSGRTVRAALDALNDIGRPRAVQLAVLVDRGHRQLPIRADYVGKNLPTSADEQVRVSLVETDGVDEVTIVSATDQPDAVESAADQSTEPGDER